MALSAVLLDPTLALPAGFYDRPVTEVARDLIGAVLVSERVGKIVAGRIVETEAYGDENDPASHASFRRNGLVRAMWGEPGSLYVYAAYGMYPCCNAVVGPPDRAGAVLIRALEILRSRDSDIHLPQIASGPGRVGRILGLSVDLNGHALQERPIWIQAGEGTDEIVEAARVGISRGTDLQWRFAVRSHPAVSRPRPW